MQIVLRVSKSFTAAQAAQKNEFVAAVAADLFTAAQAAQKLSDISTAGGLLFTAAQAAQKAKLSKSRRHV